MKINQFLFLQVIWVSTIEACGLRHSFTLIPTPCGKQKSGITSLTEAVSTKAYCGY